MKKIIIILIIISALIGLYLATQKDSKPVQNPETAVENSGNTALTRPDPTNATFIIDGESISLSGGKNVRELGAGGALVEETTLTDARAYGDINNDKREDAVVLATRTGGGSGTFVYVAGYVSGTTSYKGTNAIFLGDRIIPQTVSINSDGVITVEYLDRREDEPFAAEPTVKTVKKFIFSSGNLVER